METTKEGICTSSILPPVDWDWRRRKNRAHKIYTDALLRERLARGSQPACGMFGCANPRYAGWGDNPYHCCPVHRKRIQQVVRYERWNLVHALRGFGLPAEANLFRGNRYVKRWIKCPGCARRFWAGKTQLAGDGPGLVCPACHPESYAELVCRRCGQTFPRVKWRVEQDAGRHYQSAFCGACWGCHPGECVRLIRPGCPPVILTCTRCRQNFSRPHKEFLAAQRQRLHSAFCSLCWYHHRGQCLQISRKENDHDDHPHGG